MKHKRFWVFPLAFFLFTGLGIYWALIRSGTGLSDLAELNRFSWSESSFLLFLLLFIYIADCIRYRAMGKAMGVCIPWKTCLDAAVASFFFAWLSPASSLGAPASLVVLGGQGIPWDASTVIAFGKGILVTILVLFLAFVMMSFGLGPDLPPNLGGPLWWGGLFMVSGLLLLLVGGIFPDQAKRIMKKVWVPVVAWAEKLHPKLGPWLSGPFQILLGSIDRLAFLSRSGLSNHIAIVASNLAYLVAFIGVAVTFGVHFGGAPIAKVAGISTVFLAFTYVSPTPGGAGLAEAAAMAFFGGIMEPKQATMTVLLFRVTTFYLHIFLGFFYLVTIGDLKKIIQKISLTEDPRSMK